MEEIKYNLRLKAKIVDSGLKIKWIAKKVGLDPSILSGIINGYRIPTEAQAKKIAECLGCAVEDIF